jgi:peptidoglycan/xylan/chitin deacetylase (PgdA/CDA1 family)
MFKRYLFLAACLMAYVIFFIAYFAKAQADMSGRFREEREKYNVEGVVLTTNSPPETPAAPAAPASTATSTTPMVPASSSDQSSAPVTANASTNAAPADSSTAPMDNSAPVDTNMIIGPVPPPPSTDSNTNAPASPDTNAAPMAPSASNEPSRGIESYLVRVGYHPLATPPVSSEIAAPVASPVSTNTTSSATNTTSAPVALPVTAEPASTNAPASSEPVHGASEASVIVLLYHQFVPAGVSISPKLQWTMNQDVFESEMKYIHDNGYHVIPMSDLEKFLKHEITLPSNSVVITIDDGYKSAIVYAAPILKKYGYPWTYFVYPDFITVNEGKGAASWNDLLQLQADGVDIESHSMTHPQLPKHTQKWKGSIHLLSAEEYDDWLTNETAGSKKLLEEKLGKPINAFAYPYGAYNKEVEAKTLAAGYDYVFTVADNPVHSSTNPHSIGRYTITQNVEKDFAAYLRQGALGLADADPAPGGTTSNPRPVITAVLGYAGDLDANSIETSVRDFGVVKHDFDPKTATLRLYLPRDLIQPTNLVNIRVKDAKSGKVMVANWHFNYVPAAGDATHPPIAPSATNATSSETNTPSATPEPAVSTNSAPMDTNAPAKSEPPVAKSVTGTTTTSTKH